VHYEGNSIILSFYEYFSVALRKVSDFDDDAMHLVRAAQIVYNKMFEIKYSFNGSLTEQDAVPTLLMALVRMILGGPSIKNQSCHVHLKNLLSISQFLMFNSVNSR